MGQTNILKQLKKYQVNLFQNISQGGSFKLWCTRVQSMIGTKSKRMPILNDKEERDRNGKIKFNNIFIVTYGRSGSTLLQGILNGVDGILIRGENNNFVYHLFKSYEAIRLAKKTKKGNKPQGAWYGAHLLDDEYFIKSLRKLLKNLLLADRIGDKSVSCFGFKEIKYIHFMDDLIDYLYFLKKIFPKAAFIFNFRNNDDVAKSGWWKKRDTIEIKKLLNEFEEKCLIYQDENKESCFSIDYEDVVNKSERLNALFTFLGAEYNEKKIDYILSLPHSYDPTQKYVKNIFEQHN